MKKMLNMVMVMVCCWINGVVYARIHFGYHFGYRADAPINFIIVVSALLALIICFIKASKLKPPKIFKIWKIRIWKLMIAFSFFMFGVMFVECKYNITTGGWGILLNVIGVLVSIPAILHTIMIIYYYVCGTSAYIRLRKKIVWLLIKPADDEQ